MKKSIFTRSKDNNKIFIFMVSLIMCMTILTGCGENSTDNSSQNVPTEDVAPEPVVTKDDYVGTWECYEIDTMLQVYELYEDGTGLEYIITNPGTDEAYGIGYEAKWQMTGDTTIEITTKYGVAGWGDPFEGTINISSDPFTLIYSGWKYEKVSNIGIYSTLWQ